MDHSFIKKNGIKMLELTAINKTGVAEAYCTTREGGISTGTYASMNCNIYKSLDLENGKENFRLACKALNIDPKRVITNRLIYFTDKVRCVTSNDIVDIYDEQLSAHADGLVTNDPEITLHFYASDCAIIFLVDSEKKVIGALHAGWRGSLTNIIENTVTSMQENYGCRSKNIVAQICPSIEQCCFETGDEVAEQFATAGFSDYISQIRSKPHIDLNGVNQLRLLRAGLKAENIHKSGICTCCHPDLFHSYRRGPIDENGAHLNGLNGFFIWLNGSHAGI